MSSPTVFEGLGATGIAGLVPASGSSKLNATTKGVRRVNSLLRPLPTNLLMVAPPTVVLSAANAATSIAASTQRSPAGSGVDGASINLSTDPNFSYYGTPALVCPVGVNNLYPQSPLLTGTTSNQKYFPSLGFNFYGDAFEIVFKALVTHFEYRIRVDGQYVTLPIQAASGLTAGAVYRLLVTFASVGLHQVYVDWPGSGLGGINAKTIHTISRINADNDIPTIIAGDSISAGTGTVFYRDDSWFWWAAQRLGWRNLYNVALASTGYANAGTEAALASRTQDFAVAGARVVFYAGLNDGPNVNTTLTAAVDTCFSAVRAAGPAEVLVFGWHPKTATDYANATAIQVNAIIQQKALQYGFPFFDTLNAIQWVTGTGNIGAPNGTGNADLFVNTDAIHPIEIGGQYIGQEYSDWVAASYANLAA